MANEPIRDWLRSVERAQPEEQWAVLCLLAGRSVEVGEEELNAALRRAQLLLAAGGDPRRGLDLYGRAVTAVAEDVDRPERRSQLRTALDELARAAAGLRGVRESLTLLRDDDDLAWQCFALALVADALSDD